MNKYTKGNIGVGLLIGIILGLIVGHYAWPKSGNIIGGNYASSTGMQLTKADTLRQDMRKHWTDHAVLTHSYIVAGTANTPDKDAIATRLLKNQDDIGAAVASYYGADAGNKLTALLKSHIGIAVDIVEDARTNNTAKLNTDSNTWNANGKEIADFLAAANPKWPKEEMETMMQKHLQTTTDELMARVKKDWTGEVKAWDAVYTHILTMADGLSNGIIAQFPDKFK
ncbi:glycosyltransferase [Candidatus Parcubacteria bacterium]|nr:glycosyltransferase [Candidatus Parcubacteria bacterium]